MMGWLVFFATLLPAAFSPLAAMSAITAVMYVLSLLGRLNGGINALIVAGLALGVVAVARKREECVRGAGWLLAFAAVCVLLALRYRNTLLLSYDDFSHWGVIARHLTETGLLPTAADELIVFQSYPPASALWDAFICRVYGSGEGVMLAAQAWLTLAGVWTLFAFVRGRFGWVKAIGVLAVVLIVLSLLQGTASLMVDNLVAALAIGAMAMLIYAAEQGKRASVWCASIVLAVLCLIKDAGMFFALSAISAMWGLLAARKKCVGPVVWLVPALLPVLLRASWQVHIRLAFPAAGLTRHALSIENMRAMGADKSYADWLELAKRLLAAVFTPGNQAVQAFFLFVLTLTVSVVVRRYVRGIWQARTELRALAWGAIVLGGYIVMLWGTYAFTLALPTAMNLVALERYISACAMFLLGATAIVALTRSAEGPAVPCAVYVALLLCLPLLVPLWRSGVERLFRENYAVPLRAEMVEQAQKRPLSEGEQALWVLNGCFRRSRLCDLYGALYLRLNQHHRLHTRGCR